MVKPIPAGPRKGARVDAGAAPDAEQQTADAADLADVEGILGELDDEARFVFVIRRRIEKGMDAGKYEHLGRMQRAEFGLEAVAERWGGGAYEFRVLRKNEQGAEKFFRQFRQSIAGAPKDPAPVAYTAPVQGIPSPSDSRLDRLERILERVLERQAEGNGSANRDFEIFTKAAELMKQNAPQTQNVEGMLKLFREGMEMGKSLVGGGSGDSDGGDSLGRFAEHIGGPLMALLSKQAEREAEEKKAGLVRRRRALPAPAPVAEIPATAPVVPVWIAKARPYFPVLLAWARANDDPAERARQIVALLDAETLDSAADAAESDGFVESALAGLHPKFREPQHIAWTTALVTAFRDELTEPVPEGDEAPGAVALEETSGEGAANG